MYFLAWRRGVFPMNFFVWFVTGLGIIALIVSVVFTDVPLAVELYGWRTEFPAPAAHFPGSGDLRRQRRAAGRPVDAHLRDSHGAAGVFAVRLASRFLVQRGGGRRPERHARVRQRSYPAFGHLLVHERVERVQHSGHGVFPVAAFREAKLFPRLVWLASGGALVVLIALSGSRSVAGAAALIVAATVC